MTNKVFTLEVQEAPDGELFIEFPDNFLKEAGWSVGDTLHWSDNKDGSWTLTNAPAQKTELVLVEAVSTFRMRYMVEVPVGKADWALDTVTMNEAKEFSQQHIGEQIVSHRVVTLAEALEISDQDNDYTTSWSDEQKIKNFITTEDYMTPSDKATKYQPTDDWTEADWATFSVWLNGALHNNVVTVTFNKKDGDVRVMKCTLQPELLPEVVLKEGATERKQSTTSMRVFDVGINEWRSFITRNVTHVSFDLTPAAHPFPTRAHP